MGGTSVNTIAADACLELDLRSISPQSLEVIIGQVLSLVDEANCNGRDAIKVSAELIGDRPAGEIPADQLLVKLALECYAVKGISVKLNIGSTDANEPLHRGMPAICVGLTAGGGPHTMGEYIDTQPLVQGLGFLIDFIQAIYLQGINIPLATAAQANRIRISRAAAPCESGKTRSGLISISASIGKSAES
jgi:tripeptide aminopeptidase